MVAIIPKIQSELKTSAIKIADFSRDTTKQAVCYIGFEFEYCNHFWHIDATITKPGSIGTNPPELKAWLENMSEIERITILKLKKELIDSQRYAGSRSKPPYTFRSIHLYEGILVGKAKTIKDLENYFCKNK